MMMQALVLLQRLVMKETQGEAAAAAAAAAVAAVAAAMSVIFLVAKMAGLLIAV